MTMRRTTTQYTDIEQAQKRIEELEAQLDAVPVSAIERLFLHQFGPYPIKYNAPWDIIAAWLETRKDKA